MKIIEDTYFMDKNKALSVALKENKFGSYGNLQLCYYDGSVITDAPKNLIHLPWEQMELLLDMDTRWPTSIDCENDSYEKIFIEILEALNTRKIQQHQEFVNTLKTTPLDFSEPLRVYIAVEYYAKVVRHASENVANTFRALGYQVFFDMNDNMEDLTDYRRAKNMASFLPHLCLTINRLHNLQISDETYNFIWFQDPTLILYDSTTLNARERDYFFYLIEPLKDALIKKNIPDSKTFYQPFSIDYQQYNLDVVIERHEKIVFIGQNYFEVVSPTIEYKECDFVQELAEMFNTMSITPTLLSDFYQKHASSIRRQEHIEMHIYPAVVRREVVKWMCLHSDIAVEVYGYGWENIPEIAPYYKGVLTYGEEIAKVLYSSKYSLACHSQFYYQQRVFEASYCGCIPVIYEDILNSEAFHHHNNSLVFKNPKELKASLCTAPSEDPFKISQDMSYRGFIEKMVSIVKNGG